MKQKGKKIGNFDHILRVKVLSGQGKGKHFVNSLPPDDAIINLLGVKPYPGTLFVQSGMPLNFKGTPYRVLDNNSVKIIPAYLVDVYVVVKWTKSYPKNLQVVSDINLREHLKLQDGDYSEIRFPLASLVRNTPIIYWFSALQWAKGTKMAEFRRKLISKIRGTSGN
jgi:CTP-dependent riboflavin kinase